MAMQDKEFDDLFRSKLDGFETEPSPAVWGGVANGLDADKRKRKLASFFSIAASIIVLAAAGIVFIPQKQKPGKRKPVNYGLASVKSPVTITSAPISNKSDSVKSGIGLNQPKNKNNNLAAVKQAPALNRIANKSKSSKVDTSIQSAKPNEQLLAAVTPPKQDITNPVVPGIDVPLKQTIAIGDNPVAIAKPAEVIAQLPLTKPDEAPVKKKHRIRSLGDLINVVVAKVDKRKDKLIEFTDDDDEDSNVTSVNLGVLRIKKGS